MKKVFMLVFLISLSLLIFGCQNSIKIDKDLSDDSDLVEEPTESGSEEIEVGEGLDDLEDLDDLDLDEDFNFDELDDLELE